ncbi:MAG TPA: M14 family metallopeptidase [Bacteroidota bacterium]|nr:M14 family metallopeptidase [Bacteroidota bacterium]
MRYRILCAVLALPSLLRAGDDGRWVTDFERSGGLKTPRYAETMAYCRKLAAASPWIHVTSFGVSPQGRELPLVILARDRAFDPPAARRSRRAVILIQSGIHAGEIDGKDASLMLMRDIAVTKRLSHLLDSAVILFVPIFNVDGHERFGRFNRINQDGPEEMGWRVNAQNLNLNRDYMKCETPEMQAMLRLFNAWLPDLYVDCHVTDGIDFQYDITYAVEPAPYLDPGVSEWVRHTLLAESLPAVEKSGHKIFAYVLPREDRDLSKGLNGGASTPRFSTGFAALENRPAVLIETHMLKPYKMRVEATYEFLKAMIIAVNRHRSTLRAAVEHADASTVVAGKTHDPHTFFPLAFGISPVSEPKVFLGWKELREHSSLSGGERVRYTKDTVTLVVPWFGQVTVTDSASIPLAYIIPPEWTFVPEKLRRHSVALERLTRETTLDVDSWKFSDVKFASRPFEGRHMVTFAQAPIHERRVFPAGSLVVRTAQRAGKIVMNLLEPKGPDSFVAWGYFDAIFEQKEYAESYVMEEVGAQLIAQDTALAREYAVRVAADSAFARNPGARLNWLYQHSPWRDRLQNVYPVGKLTSAAGLQTEKIR